MERPRNNIEQPFDEFDHELTQLQTDGIALADKLLEHKPDDSPFTFVDIILPGDHGVMLEEVKDGPLSHLLTLPSEQLAIESDGSYYPRLDVRKEGATFIGMSLRVFGWNDRKIRYTNTDQKSPPYLYKEYPDQEDKTRQLEFGMSYRIGEETFSERLSLHITSSHPSSIDASTIISMPVYAETGYEGHGGKDDHSISDEAVEWFLDFVARSVGDAPKSYNEVMDARIEGVRMMADGHGVREAIDELIDGTWNAQALHMMCLPCRLLDEKSILEGLANPDTAIRAGEAARIVLRQWRERSNGQEDIDWVINWGHASDE